MYKLLIKSIAFSGIAMIMVSAGAATSTSRSTVADVIAVRDIKAVASTPRERCEDVKVQHEAPVRDDNRIAGTVVGGLAGGLLGSAIGGGNGKTVAEVAGAVAGGYAGNQVQKNMQQRDVVTSTEHRCTTVYEKSQKVVGYKVKYRLDGKEGFVQTSFKPGATLPVKNGHVLTAPQAM